MRIVRHLFSNCFWDSLSTFKKACAVISWSSIEMTGFPDWKPMALFYELDQKMNYCINISHLYVNNTLLVKWNISSNLCRLDSAQKKRTCPWWHRSATSKHPRVEWTLPGHIGFMSLAKETRVNIGLNINLSTRAVTTYLPGAWKVRILGRMRTSKPHMLKRMLGLSWLCRAAKTQTYRKPPLPSVLWQ